MKQRSISAGKAHHSLVYCGIAVRVELHSLTDHGRALNLSARQKFVRIFNNKEMDLLDGYLQAAKAKVDANSPEAKRIEFVASGMEYCRKMVAFWQKYWNTPAKERKSLIKDIDDLVAFWQKLFREKPFAISIPGQVYSNYTGFFRNCGWKPIHNYKK